MVVQGTICKHGTGKLLINSECVEMNIALCLSGGGGTRLGGDIPKQYIRVGGRMVISYSLQVLMRSEWIDAIVVVAAAQWQDEICRELISEEDSFDGTAMVGSREKRLYFADPGENRQLSILSGMEAMEKLIEGEKESTVFIHDAARPLLSEDQISACFEALSGHDGVMPVLPMKDTVYYSEDGKGISSLLQREKIFAGQAPELFLFDRYLAATRALLPDRIMQIKGSGEPAVLAGMDIVMIPGDEGNFKITTAADLERFRSMAES